MNYYKVISDQTVIGVCSEYEFRRYQAKHNIIIVSDRDRVECVQIGDRYYHDEWMAHCQFPHIDAKVLAITEEEYNTIAAAIEGGQEIPEPAEDDTTEQGTETSVDPIEGALAIPYYPISMVLFGAFLIGGLTLLLSDGFGRGAALNKSYRLAVFVMVVGTLLASWPVLAGSYMPGESLVLAGYLGLVTVLVSLFLVLAKITAQDAAVSFASGFAALFTGELIGVVAGNVVGSYADYAVVGIAGALALGSYVFLFTERDFDELSQIVTKSDDFEARCQQIAETYGLTKRELEILAFALRGRTSERIARELVISKSTVDTHLRRIYSKCAVHSRQELLDLAEKS